MQAVGVDKTEQKYEIKTDQHSGWGGDKYCSVISGLRMNIQYYEKDLFSQLVDYQIRH